MKAVIAIRGEMGLEFVKNAKKKVRFESLLCVSIHAHLKLYKQKKIQIQIKPLQLMFTWNFKIKR